MRRLDLPHPWILGSLLLWGCSGDLGENSPKKICPEELVVLGQALNSRETDSFSYTAESVVPAMKRAYGSRKEALAQASVVVWWSLKEGVFNVSNSIAFSLCARPREVLTEDPYAVCDKDAWQVGLAGKQAPRPSRYTKEQIDAKVAAFEETGKACFPELSAGQVLRKTIQDAGFGHQGSVEDDIAASTAFLRASWLLRTGCIGFIKQAPIITAECIDGEKSWCFGSGWDQTGWWAPDRESAFTAMEEIHELLDACSG